MVVTQAGSPTFFTTLGFNLLQVHNASEMFRWVKAWAFMENVLFQYYSNILISIISIRQSRHQ